MILAIRTDKPEAELGLFENDQPLAYEKWQAHRELSKTIHYQIAKNLQVVRKDWDSVKGVVVFSGPGSFTGLRIGLSFANALASGLGVPIVGASGSNWQQHGLKKLRSGKNEKAVLPDYGAPAYTTTPKN